MYENEFESVDEKDSLEESIAENLENYLEMLNKDAVDRNKQQGRTLDKSDGEVDFGSFVGDVPINGRNVVGDYDYSKKAEEMSKLKNKTEPGEKTLDEKGNDITLGKDNDFEEGEFSYGNDDFGDIGPGPFDVI